MQKNLRQFDWISLPFWIWLLFVFGVGLYIAWHIWCIKGYIPSDILRDLGLFAASAGVGPLGLRLAHKRTGYQGEELTDEQLYHAIDMLGNKSPSVKQSGVQILLKLGVGKNVWTPFILRSLASHVRSESKNVRKKYEEKSQGNMPTESKSEEREVRLHKRDTELMSKISKNLLNRPDTESSLVAISDIINKNPEGFGEMIEEAEKGKGRYTLDFSGSIFVAGRLVGTNLTKSNLSEILVENYAFEEILFKKTNLVAVYLKDCEFEECDFTESELYSTTFEKGAFSKCDFSKAIFQEAYIKLDGCKFLDCNFEDADFEDAIIECDLSVENKIENTFKGAKNLDKVKIRRSTDILASSFPSA